MKSSYLFITISFFSLNSFTMEAPLTPRSARIAQLEEQNSKMARELTQLHTALDLLITERAQERRLKDLENARTAEQTRAAQLQQHNFTARLLIYSKAAATQLVAAAQTAGSAYYLKNAIKQLVPTLPVPTAYQPIAQQILPETAGIIAQGGTVLTHKGIELLLKSPHYQSLLKKTQNGLMVVGTSTVNLLEETSKLIAHSTANCVLLPLRAVFFVGNSAYHLLTADPDPRAREIYAARPNQEQIENEWIVISKGE